MTEVAMKKRILISTCICTLCVAGCTRDNLYEQPVVDDIMEVEISGQNYTKSGGDCASCEEELLFTKQLVTEQGDTLYLSAYLSDMEDDIVLDTKEPGREETKGAPIYFNETNKNLGTLYGKVSTTVYAAADGKIYKSIGKDGESEDMENVSVPYVESKWSFDKTYYWPKSGGDLYFCTLAPVGLIGSLVTGGAWDNSNKKYSFNYSMPAPDTEEPYDDAVNQRDVLVALDVNNKTNGPKAKISLYHALTGVRFVMGESTAGVKLKSVSLNNFNSKGTATVVRGRNKANNADSTMVGWSGLSTPKSFTQSYTDEEVVTWTQNADFDGTANKEKTFMVIPQTLGENAELSIYLANALHPEVLKFNMITTEEPALADWSNYAGKMITFRINSYVGLVSVNVYDDCDTANGVKSNIAITNDGNAEIFVRAELVGNWINSNGQILASWREDDSYGTFVSSKGSNAKLSEILDDNWQKAADGFYYYKYYVKPREVLKNNMFNTFTLSSKPHDSEGKWEGNVDMQIDALELTILVQAVRADSEKASAIAAWGSGNVGFLTNEADK